jgi:exonuclease SbcD
MKVLHTSDWHLGRVTWNESRSQDHEAVLAEIVDIATAQSPDLILNTGDLFDQYRPPIHALRLATDVLHQLAAIAPVVVILGNHDSAPLMDWIDGLMRHGDRIHLVAAPAAMNAGTVLRFPTTGGRIHVAALPFITANRIVNVSETPEGRRRSYADFIATLQHDLLTELHDDFDPATDVSIYAAHQYVAGASPSTTENRNHTCDFYSTDPDRLPGVDYAAFGHIHKPQSLPGNRVVGAYAGSPIQLDFGEEGEDKSVVVAHLETGTPTQLSHLPLTAGRRLRRLTGTIEQLHNRRDDVTDEICHVTVKTTTHELNLQRQVQDIFPNATLVYVHEDCADRKLDLITSAPPVDGEPDNHHMFATYLAERTTNKAPAGDVLSLFDTLLSTADDDTPPTLDADELLSADLAAFAVPAIAVEGIGA